jgi:trans-2,3-dihydro-3-hydroxyanthranilate isomerase
MPIEVGSAGVPSIYVPLRSRDALHRAVPGHPDLKFIAGEAASIGVYCFVPEIGSDRTVVAARYFVPVVGISEDPATGSAAGPVGTYLVAHGIVQPDFDGTARLDVEQGVDMGRPSLMNVQIQQSEGAITGVRVGGHAVLVARGELFLNGA